MLNLLRAKLKGSRFKASRFKKLNYLFLLVPLYFISCGAPALDATDASGLRAIIDAVNIALSSGDCKTAITLIEPIYNSEDSTNDIRRARASAQGCRAGINFFPLVQAIATPGALLGPEFWITVTREFPFQSQASAEAAWLAMDALQAITKKSVVISPTNEITVDEFNTGSLVTTDRSAEANMYMIFASYAVMGELNNKWGAPDANYEQGALLPWTNETTVDEEGCGYAAAFLNSVDSINSVLSSASGAVATGFQEMIGIMQSGLNAACEAGCQATLGITTCAGIPPGDCTPCPIRLRYRDCIDTAVADAANPLKCSAAGIINFVNDNPAGGWTGP